MSMETLASDELERKTESDRFEALAASLAGLADVYSCHAHGDRHPPRVEVVLDVANVTPAVADRLEAFDAVVDPASMEVNGRGTLTFHATTPERFKPAGSRDARDYGASTAWTFTPESLELSRFTDESHLEAFARRGAVLLVESDHTPWHDQEGDES